MRAPAIPACLLGAGILITILAWPQLTAAPDEGRLVQVHVTRQIQNPFLPWQHGAPAPIVGYGYFINETQVLTTENLVRNHRLVELLRPKTGDKIAGKRGEIHEGRDSLGLSGNVLGKRHGAFRLQDS